VLLLLLLPLMINTSQSQHACSRIYICDLGSDELAVLLSSADDVPS
jgi:hypothetical protein